MYSFTSRIRYSEVNRKKELDLSAIINYFQDCTIFQSEDSMVGIDFVENTNCAWMLSSWQIIVNRYPKLGETITSGTWAYDFDNLYGYRNFTLTDSNNEICAYANSTWILVDLVHLHPTRLTESVISAYPIEERFDMDYAERKIAIPKELQEGDPITVVSSNLDTNNHVNNGQYIKMAEEFLPDNFNIKEMRADYRVSALLGDIIYPKYHITDKECTVVLCQNNNKPYTIIKFIS